MGLFNRKEKKEENPKMPDLPEIPELPALPDWEKENKEEELPQLPSFPNNSFGEKFSKNSIKDAVTGEKEERGFEADEFVEEEPQMMQKPLVREEPLEFSSRYGKITKPKETGPVFIKIEKFNESLQIFEKAKRQLADIEKTLEDVKRIKDEETRELSMWEKEMRDIKEKIERIDNNIFSRVE